ncbi:MAG: hypothetical protein PUB98_06625 [Clostridiales bacterium]|nr:hypothetical protein [Clostridiales bacterium]
MRYAGGSLTIEAALIFSTILLLLLLVMGTGIDLYEEVRQEAVSIMEEEKQDTIKMFYRWNMLRETLTDANSL